MLDHNENKKLEMYGKISSVLSIIINIFLFISKFIIGFVSNSISIKADAVNNLSDIWSAIISFISFKFSNKPADKEHPFGHARFEYIASLIVAFIIINFGINVFFDSIKKVINPVMLEINYWTFLVLIISISLKLFLYFYNMQISKKINSSVLKATAIDSLSDVISTAAIILSILIYKFTNVNIDGYFGVFVSCFILFSGYTIVKESFNNLLGKNVSDEMSASIKKFILEYDDVVLGLHDLIVHDYGNSKSFATVHVEVSHKDDFLKTHDVIDKIEREVYNKFNIDLVIHLDPIIVDNEHINSLKDMVLNILKNIDYSFDMHDFRVINIAPYNHLVFDVEVPFNFKLKNKEIILMIEKNIKEFDQDLYSSINIDRV